MALDLMSLNPFKKSAAIYLEPKRVRFVIIGGKHKKPQLEKWDDRPYGETEPQEGTPLVKADRTLQIAVNNFVIQNKLKGARILLSLASGDLFIRYFQMPYIPPDERSQAVRFEAKKYIPFKVDEMILDFRVNEILSKPPRLDVILIAAKKELVGNLSTIFKQSGLELEILEAAPISLIRAFYFNKQIQIGETAAILLVKKLAAELCIVKNHIPYLVREITLPEQADLAQEHLLGELRISWEYFEKHFPVESVSKIILCFEEEPGNWEALLSEEFRIPVKLADLSFFDKSKKAPINDLIVPIGLALRRLVKETQEINLVKKETRMAAIKEVVGKKPEVKAFIEGRQKLIRRLITGVVCMVIFLFLGNRITPFFLIGLRNQLEKIKKERVTMAANIDLNKIEEIERYKADQERRLAFLENGISKRSFWTSKLDLLAKVIPEGVWLSGISIEDSGFGGEEKRRSLVLRGAAFVYNDKAEEQVRISKFLDELNSLPNFTKDFKNIELRNISNQQIENTEVTTFEIVCAY
jgi:Tfp pilus assembly protein PilN